MVARGIGERLKLAEPTLHLEGDLLGRGEGGGWGGCEGVRGDSEYVYMYTYIPSRSA